jgi:hypothetical protein
VESLAQNVLLPVATDKGVLVVEWGGWDTGAREVMRMSAPKGDLMAAIATTGFGLGARPGEIDAASHAPAAG